MHDFQRKSSCLSCIINILHLCLGFSIRMVNPYTGLPTNDTKGNVQVFYLGKWRFWEQKSLNTKKTWVICRELGFIRPLDYRLIYNLTEVQGNLVRNQDMKCTGKEEKLIDCQHESWEFLNKTHDFYLVWVKCGEFLLCTRKVIPRKPIVTIFEILFV